MPKKEVKIILGDEIKTTQGIGCDCSKLPCPLAEELSSTAKTIDQEAIMKILERAKWTYGVKVMQGEISQLEPLELAKAQASAIIDYIAGGGKE